MLERVTFDEQVGELTIALSSRRTYAYLGVSLDLYRALCRATSPGRFYNEQIKGRFACRDLSPRRRFRPVQA